MDVEIMIKNSIIETSVVEPKILSNWSPAVRKNYKWNAILGDLHMAHRTPNNFKFKKQRTKKHSLMYNLIQSTFNLLQSTFNSKLAI